MTTTTRDNTHDRDDPAMPKKGKKKDKKSHVERERERESAAAATAAAPTGPHQDFKVVLDELSLSSSSLRSFLSLSLSLLFSLWLITFFDQQIVR
jgi:hypothetical protein